MRCAAFFIRALATCLALSWATCMAAANDTLAAARAEFRQAWDAIGTSSTATDSPQLADYAPYTWLQAERLVQALRRAGEAVPATLDEATRAFLAAHEGEPAAQGLRRAFLASLAARSQWPQYLAFHHDASDGPALRCHGFTARIELQHVAGLAPAITQAWLTPRSLPECERAFRWLEETGALDAALVEQRVRLALEAGNAGFARQLARQLPQARAAPLLQWAALLENPQREIDALLGQPGAAVEQAALLAGWAKLARANRSAATQRFERLVTSRKLDRKAASAFALALALPLSWDRNADALDYFARVEPADFDDTAREWYIRAALWGRHWQRAGAVIATLTPQARDSARWRYWAARVADARGDDEGARRLYESILADDNYYSGLAAARLGRPLAPHPRTVAADAAQIEAMATLPPFVRARELLQLGLDAQARAEWRHGRSALAPTVREQAIHLASDWGWYQQAVATATEDRVFNDYALLYPRPYDAQVATASRRSGLPPRLIYGVIRQESLYQRDARSSANARGLMQMLLETAQRTARKWKLPAPTSASLFDADVNTTLGAAHLADLLERFDGQWPLALAAYNAGPGAAQRWRPQQALDADIWIENIPYNETRNYVQRILWHTLVFGWLVDGSAQDTRQWLQPVRP